MSEVRIRRKSVVATATVGTSTADATAMDCNAMVGGIITFDAALPTAATALTFYASDTATGPYYQLHDKDGAAVSVTLVRQSATVTATDGTQTFSTTYYTAARAAYPMPYESSGCGFVRVVSNAALGTASTARVALKG